MELTEYKVPDLTKKDIEDMVSIPYAVYQCQASSTAMYASADYPFMLLLEEFHEYTVARSEEDTLKELGDVQWCISQCYKELGLINHTPESGVRHDTPILVVASVLAKGMRKHQRSLVELIQDAVEVGIYDDLVMALDSLNAFCAYKAIEYGSHITEVRRDNMLKLLDRKKRKVIDGAGDNR